MKIDLEWKETNYRFDQKSRIVTITHPITKDFKGLDAQVWDEDKVVNFNISDCTPEHK